MIERFTLTNKQLSKQVIFGQDYDCDYLFQDDGLDWGIAQGEHSTYTYPGQIGSSISNSSVKERDIIISGFVFYVPTDEDKASHLSRSSLQDFVYSKIKEKKEKLNELINPLNDIRITIGDYYIEGKPSQSISYGKTSEDNNKYFCKFLIYIFCNNPTFRKDVQISVANKSVQGAFHFPLVFNESFDFVMGIRTNYNSIFVDNEGGVEVGGKIIIQAHGEVKNIEIKNVLNDDTMKIVKTLQDGERIEINTRDGEKSIKGFVQGFESNYLKYLDFGGDWITFTPGRTLISYLTENESESLIDISVEINPAKLALEDM